MTVSLISLQTSQKSIDFTTTHCHRNLFQYRTSAKNIFFRIRFEPALVLSNVASKETCHVPSQWV